MTQAGTPGPSDRVVLVALGIVPLVLFARALAGGVFFQRDIHAYWQPQVETLVRVTRSAEDFARLAAIAAADPAYARRFAEVSPRLSPRPPVLRARPGGVAGDGRPGAASAPPARPRGDADGGTSEVPRERRGTPRDR